MVEGCVNSVGVEVSTASAALLAHVAGIGPALAKNSVAYREENGIQSRAQLKKVPKLGPKAFEDVYKRQAVAYAKRWALLRNPAYLDFHGLGGDLSLIHI